MTPSRPLRAMRGAAALLALVAAFRIPAIEHRFAAALAAGAGPPAKPAARRAVVLRPRPMPSALPSLAVVEYRAVAHSPPPRAGHRADPRSASAVVAVAASDATIAPPPPPVLASRTAPPDANALATAAYARLGAGDRRGAVRLFDAALAGDDPRVADWRRQRDALTRRWSGSAYSIVRAGGDPALAVTPVLGGGQSGAAIAFTPDPLSPRPFAVTARGSVAHDDRGRSAFAAVGVQWHPFTGVTVAAERLIAVGPAAPNDWTVRLAAGTDRTYGRWRATVYGEGGIVGHADYAAFQGRAAAVFHLAHVELDPGAGVWSSIQRDPGTLVDRVDVGPGVAMRAGPFAAEVDYRFRVAGNAAPGSGPVLTLSAGF